MFYYDYSDTQIEGFADDLNRQYDPTRLTTPKPVDVYDIVDHIGARLAFEYITPDRTYLGATIFDAGSIYVWPSNPYVKGMMPEKKFFQKGTIIIDRDLCESKTEQDHFIENFTVIHECFHFKRHPKCFRRSGHASRPFSDYAHDQADKNSPLYIIERQANYAAAAFLMPRDAVIKFSKELLYYDGECSVPFGYYNKPTIKEMGAAFGVNYTPMVYRLQELGILDRSFNPYI